MDAPEATVHDELLIPWPEVRELLTEMGREYLVLKERRPRRFVARLESLLRRRPDLRLFTVRTASASRWLVPVTWYIAILIPKHAPVESADELQFIFGPVRET
jgi:hypothetical protein